jgi:hypothetical protein
MMPYMVELINNIRARIYENTYLDKILRVSQSTAGSWNFSVGVQILIFTEPANLNTISPSLEKREHGTWKLSLRLDAPAASMQMNCSLLGQHKTLTRRWTFRTARSIAVAEEASTSLHEHRKRMTR